MRGELVMEKEKRIEVNPKVMAGTRLTAHYILSLLASGMTVDEILSEYEGLEREDILACLAFAAESLERTEFVPLAAEAIY